MRTALALLALLLVTGGTAAAARRPLAFVWPTSVAVEKRGTVLVVENGLGRVWRIDPRKGTKKIVAKLSRPIAVATTQAGGVLVSTENDVVRIGGGKVASADAQVGPIAVAPSGDVWFTAGSHVFRNSEPAADGFAGAHGIAVTADGTVLVADTDHDAVKRLDGSTFAQVGGPRGIAVARDGTLYVVDAQAKRIVHLSATGGRLGTVGPKFGDPYAVAADAKGGVYVVDTAAFGRVRYVAKDGRVSTLSSAS
jgi:sugar lactone lactonase YvrE